MAKRNDKSVILQQLRRGLGTKLHPCSLAGMPKPHKEAFPHDLLGSGLHEILSGNQADHAAAISYAIAACRCAGNIAQKPLLIGSMAKDAQEHGCLHGAGLPAFGLPPGNVYTVTVRQEKELLWAAEEAANCSALSGAIFLLPASAKLYGFTASRRLKLRIERSGIPVFMVLHNHGEASAALARWRVKTLPSQAELTPASSVPLTGAPRFHVCLERYSGSPPQNWELELHAAHGLRMAAPLSDRPARTRRSGEKRAA